MRVARFLLPNSVVFHRARATALRHPCLLAGETAHPRFAQTLPMERGASLVLTINRGYE